MTDVQPPNTPMIGIGALLRQFQQEFPHLTASKVRFLEDQGLVRPHRTASGYRKYTAQDAERLRTILRLQQERYLPLKVIRQRLERGEDPAQDTELQQPVTHTSTGIEPQDAPAQATPEVTHLTGHRYSIRQLAAEADAEISVIRELVNHGLITERDGAFDDYARTVASAAGRLAGYGIEPRHLRGMRAATDRVMSLVEGSIAPLLSRRDATSRAATPQLAREIASLCLTLVSAQTNSRLDETLPPTEQDQ